MNITRNDNLVKKKSTCSIYSSVSLETSCTTKNKSRHVLLVGGGTKHSETAYEIVVHRHYCTRIVELSAVVGRRKQGHQLPIGLKLVTVFYNLYQS